MLKVQKSSQNIQIFNSASVNGDKWKHKTRESFVWDKVVKTNQ